MPAVFLFCGRSMIAPTFLPGVRWEQAPAKAPSVEIRRGRTPGRPVLPVITALEKQCFMGYNKLLSYANMA